MTLPDDEAELVRIPGGINAEAMVTALRGRGIPARLTGEVAGPIFGLTLDGLGERTILVPKEKLEEAQALLDAAEDGTLELGENDSVDPMGPDFT